MPEDIKKCCYTCKYLEYDKCSSDRAYCSGQKDAPRIERPVYHVCDRYKNMMYKDNDATNSHEPALFVYKQITTTTTVFNPDFWRVGDVYVIRCNDESIVFVSVLQTVKDLRIVFENGVEVQLNSILNNRVSVIKHITKESLIKDVI